MILLLWDHSQKSKPDMNVQLLIDAIVRQTTVLIAQLATAGGIRAPLAHVANQVFLDLARELEAQGVSRKVSASMFGMALRAYLRKVQRLSESSTDRGRSLWEAVYDFLRSQDVVTRGEVIERFNRDEEALVRGVLHDLCESGLVFSTGTAQDAVFRAATDAELGRMQALTDGRIDELLWAMIYVEGPLTRGAFDRIDALKSADVEGALARLIAAGRIVKGEKEGVPEYHANHLAVPLGAHFGWEAAVYDHFHAMVVTISKKLSIEQYAASGDATGGSTYSFVVWPGHAFEDPLRGALKQRRSRRCGPARHGPLRRTFECNRRGRVGQSKLGRPRCVAGRQRVPGEPDGDGPAAACENH